MVWSDPPYGISIVAANGYVGGGEAYDYPFGGVKNMGYVGGVTATEHRSKSVDGGKKKAKKA
jgi:acyl-CoA reductase-like NAD-dependent aldehyde dehydrogenase